MATRRGMGRRRVRSVAGVLLAVASLLGLATAPSWADPAPLVLRAATCMEPGNPSTAVPWPQTMLGFDRVWPLSTGAGVTVAVLDSGVDSHQPQLRGHVATGADFLHGNGKAGGTTDCVGHGTAIASIIAAQHQDDSGLRGVAPDARILPVTVSEKSAATDNGLGDAATPAQFGAALRWAVDHGAEVVNVSVVYYTDYPEIRSAVEYALASNVVIVAAVGNLGADNDKNPTPYPAAYPGVIGVGAVDRTGKVTSYSGHGSFVDLVAPGEAVVAAVPGRGQGAYDGTSMATPFVTGAAALVRQYWPGLKPAGVQARLKATADPVPVGSDRGFYGGGLVDPYRAVTEHLDATPALDQPPAPAVPSDDAALAAAARERHVRGQALAVAGVAGTLALIAIVGSIARRRARRTRWRPTRAAPLPVRDDEPDLAPVGLFDEPT